MFKLQTCCNLTDNCSNITLQHDCVNEYQTDCFKNIQSSFQLIQLSRDSANYKINKRNVNVLCLLVVEKRFMIILFTNKSFSWIFYANNLLEKFHIDHDFLLYFRKKHSQWRFWQWKIRQLFFSIELFNIYFIQPLYDIIFGKMTIVNDKYIWEDQSK